MNSALLARAVLRPGVLDAADAAALRALPADSNGEQIAASLLADLGSGRSRCCHIIAEGQNLGFIIFTVRDGNELVINAAFGRDGRSNIVALLVGDGALLLSLARQAECDTIAFHTVRPGLVARAFDHGFRVAEVIMRKNIR